jgi:hypothetical protein
MADLPEDLAAVVKDQAEARVAMNVQGFAKYLTPAAVDSLRASFPGVPPRVSRFEVGDTSGGGSEYTVNIRYFVRDDPFIVRSTWKKDGDAWMVSYAERLWEEGEARPGPLNRLAGSVIRWVAGLRRSR